MIGTVGPGCLLLFDEVEEGGFEAAACLRRHSRNQARTLAGAVEIQDWLDVVENLIDGD